MQTVLITRAALLALVFAATRFSALVSAGSPDRIGAYYNNHDCGSGAGHELSDSQTSPILFSDDQGAKSVRMDKKSFTIYKDKDCTKAPRSQGPGGCADFGGQLIRCIKY